MFWRLRAYGAKVPANDQSFDGFVLWGPRILQTTNVLMVSHLGGLPIASNQCFDDFVLWGLAHREQPKL